MSELDKLWDKVGKAPTTWHASTVMKDLIETKFGLYTSGQPKDFPIPMYLFKKLVRTGGAKLVFGNYLHDNYWGQCLCNQGDCLNFLGKNLLGHILMLARQKINDKIKLFSQWTDWCPCGDAAEQTVLYTKGWVPRTKAFCGSVICTADAIKEVTRMCSDGWYFSYPVEGSVQMEMPPLQESKPVNQIIAPTTTTTAAKTDDDDDEEGYAHYNGYNQYGVWMGVGYAKPPPTPERKFETLVIHGK